METNKQPEPLSQEDLISLQKGELTKKQKEELAKKQGQAMGAENIG